LKKKILITGINGFLGSHLAKHLKNNFEVVGLEYSIDNLYRIKNDGFMVYESNE
jgi:nucleoside-diphosphate-sugar epimerase